MDTHNILSADYLDLVFDGRNKAYGSYELRRNYSRRVGKSLLVLATIGLSITAYGLINNRTVILPEKPKSRVVSCPFVPPPPIEPKKITPPPPAAPPPPARPTVKFPPPVITNDHEVREDEKPPEMDDFKNASAGAKTEVGIPNGSEGTFTEGPGGGGGSGSSVVEPPAPPKEPFITVEQMPQFNGDVQRWLAENVVYPEAAREAGIEGRVVVKFVVAEDGSVTEAVVERSVNSALDAEALRAIRKMPRWKPGKQNGQAVKVYFRVPVKFALD